MFKTNKMIVILLTIFLVWCNNLFSEVVSSSPVMDINFGIKTLELDWSNSPWFRDSKYLGVNGIYIYSNDYWSIGVIKLNSDGIKLWDRYKEVEWVIDGFFVDGNGNAFTGYLNSLWDDRSYLVRYDNNGNEDEIEVKIEKEIGNAEVLYKYQYPLGIFGIKGLNRVYIALYYEWLLYYPEEERDEYIWGVVVKCYNSITGEHIFTKDYSGNEFFGGNNFWETSIMIKGDDNGDIYIASISDLKLKVEKFDSDLNFRNVILNYNLPMFEGFNIEELKLGGDKIVIDYGIESLVITKDGGVLYTISNIQNEPFFIELDKEGKLYRVENAYIEGEDINRISKYRDDGSIEWWFSEGFENWFLTELVVIDDENRLYTIGDFYDTPQDRWYYYVARYIQPLEIPKRYIISKSTSTDNQIVYVNEYSEALVSVVSELDSGRVVSGIGVNFEISRYPIGAIGQELTISSTTTDQNGQAITQLKLGNIPAEYGVVAICSDCVPEFSSVTFSCCGKLANDHFSQSGVVAWSYDCYANNDCQITPNATIGWRGCALTSLATLINYYAKTYPELNISTTNPGELNEYLRKNDGYNENNDVDFNTVNNYSNGKMKYIGKESGDINSNLTKEILLNRADREILSGRPVIFKIFRGLNQYHFVTVIGKCGDNYIIADPAGGIERIYNPNENGYLFTGIRIFRP